MPETGRPPAGPDKVIVVEQRPGRGPVQLLPPLLIVLGGLAFLTYRSTQADWQGLGRAFERARPRAQARPARPAETAVASVPSPEPAPLVGAGAAPAVPEAVAAAGPVEAAPKAAAKPEDTAAWDDIKRESEATERRLAELQREKEEASRKLAETEGKRQEEARHDRRFAPVPPRPSHEELVAAQRERNRRMFAQAFELHERQRQEMEAMRERFLSGGGPGFPGFAPGFRPAPPLMPRAGRPAEGFAEVREFRGNNGVVRFHMRWRSDRPPAPPEPGLKVDPQGRPID